MERPLTIGQLARATSVPAKTIRYIVVQGEQELMLSCCGQLMEKRELRV